MIKQLAGVDRRSSVPKFAFLLKRLTDYYLREFRSKRNMLSGVKFLPRDQISTGGDSSVNEKRKSDNKRDVHRRKKKDRFYGSSDDEQIEKIKKDSKRIQRQYSSFSSESGDSSSDESIRKSREKLKHRKKNYSSESSSSSTSTEEETHGKRRTKHRIDKKMKRTSRKSENEYFSVDSKELVSHDDKDVTRKEMGLEWMLKPENVSARTQSKDIDLPEDGDAEEETKPNPKELNPYFKDNGSGYPEEGGEIKVGDNQLFSSSIVGDGGASWRLKALKRAQEQAAREGQKLEEIWVVILVIFFVTIYCIANNVSIVEERWGSLGHLVVSAASYTAPARAHLHAIKDRKRGLKESSEATLDAEANNSKGRREYFKDASIRKSDMKEPKIHDSLSWRKKKGQNSSVEDTSLIAAATSSLNKFADDGSFLLEANRRMRKYAEGSSVTRLAGSEMIDSGLDSSIANKPSEDNSIVDQALSTNQLAAKAMQLRMKGKHEEANKLMNEVEILKAKQASESKLSIQGIERSNGRCLIRDSDVRQKKKEEDADLHLAHKIARNKQYSVSGQADDEYDFDGDPVKNRRHKTGAKPDQLIEKSKVAQRILTQQERCHFCFENPSRPRHLVISIANFTYLMLPQRQPVVQGHCYIVPLQHESATRNVDDNVWEEIRNFKKCLIMMFRKQEKEVVFLETVIGLAKQRRHCLVECIPLPEEIARQAPLYFKKLFRIFIFPSSMATVYNHDYDGLVWKKAIDEAEDEWSQHNAKKLINTGEKGLRGSIPKHFPYFHVEFGLKEGFVHVIDDESQFNSSLGLNVIRGMLQLPEEDMHRRVRYESIDRQKAAVATFAQQWEPLDWTKQLD
ncbi:hypothetical protein Scep_020453 [Stephania cephalantha]|uniref:CWF19-like protein 2 n=1 Tax=Stephania cephalantha TaxID=152367 RepID=A0AAP0ICM5_9MAGN